MSGMHRNRMNQVQKHNRIRRLIQAAAAVLFNGYGAGFVKGTIYTGDLKSICVPVLNCYSCPGALGSCPIGALQAVIGGAGRKFSFYVVGTLMLFGMVLGRLICGFLCPFGLIQDLLHKIPGKKLTVPRKADRVGRYLKYLILAVLVLLLPMVVTDSFGQGSPFFCKLFCPAGTLEGGIFHVLNNEGLRAMVGVLFSWKMAVLVIIIAGSVFISRFFCKYFCPLGAIYSLFNRVSLYRMHLDSHQCVGCKTCEHVCPMTIEVTRHINSGECIRCGKCKAACPTGAISSEFIPKPQRKPTT